MQTTMGTTSFEAVIDRQM